MVIRSPARVHDKLFAQRVEHNYIHKKTARKLAKQHRNAEQRKEEDFKERHPWRHYIQRGAKLGGAIGCVLALATPVIIEPLISISQEQVAHIQNHTPLSNIYAQNNTFRANLNNTIEDAIVNSTAEFGLNLTRTQAKELRNASYNAGVGEVQSSRINSSYARAAIRASKEVVKDYFVKLASPHVDYCPNVEITEEINVSAEEEAEIFGAPSDSKNVISLEGTLNKTESTRSGLTPSNETSEYNNSRSEEKSGARSNLENHLSEPVHITDDPAIQSNPSIHKNKIVWEDERNGNYDIYMRDLGPDGVPGTGDDGGEFRITDETTSQSVPQIHEGKIVWEDERNGNPDVYMSQIKNEPPVLSPTHTPVQASVGKTLYLNLSASDPDNDDLTFKDNSPYFVISKDGKVEWMPDNNSPSFLDVEFDVEDGYGGMDSQDVRINVNRPPLFLSSLENAKLKVGEKIEKDIDIHDYDKDVMEIVLESDLDILLTKSDDDTFNLSYEAREKDIGKHEIKMSLTDGIDKAFMNFTLEVEKVPEPPNNPPEMKEFDKYTTKVGSGDKKVAEIDASDPDNDSLEYRIMHDKRNLLRLEDNEIYLRNTTTEDEGSYNITIGATDNKGGHINKTLWLEILKNDTKPVEPNGDNETPKEYINQKPEQIKNFRNYYEFESNTTKKLLMNLSNYFNDPDGDNLSYAFDSHLLKLEGYKLYLRNLTEKDIGRHLIPIFVGDNNGSEIMRNLEIIIKKNETEIPIPSDYDVTPTNNVTPYKPDNSDKKYYVYFGIGGLTLLSLAVANKIRTVRKKKKREEAMEVITPEIVDAEIVSETLIPKPSRYVQPQEEFMVTQRYDYKTRSLIQEPQLPVRPTKNTPTVEVILQQIKQGKPIQKTIPIERLPEITETGLVAQT